MASAIYSAIKGIRVDNRLAMTGELSIHGRVKPVGGIVAKVEAAQASGSQPGVDPQENMQAMFSGMDGIQVIPVRGIDEVLQALPMQAGEEQQGAVSASVLNRDSFSDHLRIIRNRPAVMDKIE